MSLVRKLSRRETLRLVGSGSAFALSVALPAPADPGDKAPTVGTADGVLAPNIFVSIAASGEVTLTVTRSEMGQGIRTIFAMILADELAASWPKVLVKQADGEPRFGDQDTDASRSVRLFFKPLRLAAATARQMLEAAAAQTFRAAIADCRAVDNEVIHVPSGRTLGFGQLVKLASGMPVPAPDKVKLKDMSSWRYIGHPTPDVDLPLMARGRTLYGADIVLPGMRYAAIERCPVYGGKVRSFDASQALKIPGVHKVIELPASPIPSGHLPLGGVAVIASDSWTAMEARKKLQIDWDLGPNANHDSTAYRSELEAAVRRAGKIVRVSGNFETGFSGSAARASGEYFVPYQAHATIEPPVAVAAYDAGRLTVHAPTQNPQAARAVVAQYLGLKDTDVTVHPTFLGNGFGRKGLHDFVCEAAWLAKTLGGKVKLVWSREDDIRHGYYHPMMAHRLDGGVDKNGNPVAWRHRVAFPSLTTTFKADLGLPDAAQIGQGLTDVPYSIPNLRCEVATAPAHLRLAATRGGLALSIAFASCSFIDELANAAGKDTANFLFNNYAGPRKIDFKALGVDYPNYGASLDEYPFDVSRLQNVVQLAMDRSGWGTQLLPHQGRGIAAHRSFGSYVAAVIVATVSPEGAVSVPRVDLVIDCGHVINPDKVTALMQDSILFGLSFAMFGAITVKNGAVEQTGLDDYRLAPATMTPEMRIHLVPSLAPPSGAGDPAAPVIAPALCNAIFQATGRRIRALPIDMTALKDTGSPKAGTPPKG